MERIEFIRAAILIARNDHLPESHLEQEIYNELDKYLKSQPSQPESVFAQPAKKAAERQRQIAKEHEIMEATLQQIAKSALDALPDDEDDLDTPIHADIPVPAQWVKPTKTKRHPTSEALFRIAQILEGKKSPNMTKREREIYEELAEFGLVFVNDESRVCLVP
jgi:hypothetical protein